MTLVSVIMPCFRAQEHIERSARSVLNQTHANLELILISDDLENYEEILKRAGISDPRIRHVSTGENGSGVSRARNKGLDHARADIVAFLDSDDEFKPTKLERCIPALENSCVVSCGVEVRAADGSLLRHAATHGHDRLLTAGEYYAVHISTHTMLVLDRKRMPARYAEDARRFEDFDFTLRCFEHTERIFHIVEPLHAYYKIAGSLTHSQDTEEHYKSVKNLMLGSLGDNTYAFIDPNAAREVSDLLKISIKAEHAYWEKVRINPATLFEDVFEDLLAQR